MGARSAYQEAARKTGQLLAERQIRLVYGGGNIGLMGLVADAAMQAGGSVVGVIPKSLAEREVAHHEITELKVVDSMHARKAEMANLSDAFVALPGGYGTLEEFCEIVTWCQLGLHRKVCGLLNIDGYFDPLLDQFDRGVRDKFIREAHRQLILSSTEPGELLDRFVQHQPPDLTAWLNKRDA